MDGTGVFRLPNGYRVAAGVLDVRQGSSIGIIATLRLDSTDGLVISCCNSEVANENKGAG
jgi:hypothetical protein